MTPSLVLLITPHLYCHSHPQVRILSPHWHTLMTPHLYCHSHPQVRVPPPHPSSGSILKPEYITHDPSLVPPFTHLYGTRLPETSIRKTFDRPSRKPMALIPLAGRIRGGKPRRSQTMRTEPNSCKRMTLPSTQNLKAVGLCESSYLYITQLSHSYPM